MPSNILLLNNWRECKILEDPQFGNELKRGLTDLPGGHLANLPFMLSSGKDSINILNGEMNSMQTLIYSANLPNIGQAGCTFTKIEVEDIVDVMKWRELRFTANSRKDLQKAIEDSKSQHEETGSHHSSHPDETDSHLISQR